MTKAVARAIVRHEYSDELRTHVRSRIGYIAEAGNTWRGKWRTTFAAAQADAREYNRGQEPPVPSLRPTALPDDLADEVARHLH